MNDDAVNAAIALLDANVWVVTISFGHVVEGTAVFTNRESAFNYVDDYISLNWYDHMSCDMPEDIHERVDKFWDHALHDAGFDYTITECTIRR